MRGSFATFAVMVLALAFGASSADAGLLDSVKKEAKKLKGNKQAEQQDQDDAQNAQSSEPVSREQLRAEANKPNLGSKLRKLWRAPGAAIDNAVISIAFEKKAWQTREEMRDAHGKPRMRFVDHENYSKMSGESQHEHGQRLDAAADRYEVKLRQRASR